MSYMLVRFLRWFGALSPAFITAVAIVAAKSGKTGTAIVGVLAALCWGFVWWDKWDRARAARASGSARVPARHR